MAKQNNKSGKTSNKSTTNSNTAVIDPRNVTVTDKAPVVGPATAVELDTENILQDSRVDVIYLIDCLDPKRTNLADALKAAMLAARRKYAEGQLGRATVSTGKAAGTAKIDTPIWEKVFKALQAKKLKLADMAKVMPTINVEALSEFFSKQEIAAMSKTETVPVKATTPRLNIEARKGLPAITSEQAMERLVEIIHGMALPQPQPTQQGREAGQAEQQ